MNFRLLLILPLLAFTAAGCPNDEKSTESSTSDGASETTAPTTTTDATMTDATTTDAPATDATTDATTTDATTDEPTTEPTTDGTTSPTDPPSACACIDTESYGPDSYTCPMDVGCGVVKAFCDVEMGGDASACDGWGAFSVDEVALDCTLDRLIAGDAGLVWWEIDSNGPAWSGAFLEVTADRVGLGRSWEFIDLSGTDSPAGTVSVKDAAYFETCKAAIDVEQKFLCMTAWWTSPPAATCDVAGEISDV